VNLLQRYVKQKVQKTKKGNFWVNYESRSKPTLQAIFKMLGTSSNKEFAQITEGIMYDLSLCDEKTRNHILQEIFQHKIL